MCTRTVHTLPSSFLFPIIIYHCKIYQEKENINKKEAGKCPNFKNDIFYKIMSKDVNSIKELLHQPPTDFFSSRKPIFSGSSLLSVNYFDRKKPAIPIEN